MPDEQERRRSDFSPGPEVILGDGNRWRFPNPTLRLFPVRGDDGRIEIGGGPSFGSEYEGLMDELADADPGDASTRLTIQFRMATLLLTRNYELSDRELRDLLVIDAEEPECLDRWRDINQALTGRSPKVSAGGSAAP